MRRLLIFAVFLMLLVSVPVLVGGADADNTDVARIGNIYFDDLNEAMDSAKGGDVVIIVSSTSVAKNVTIPFGVTLLIPYADAKGQVDIDGTKDGESLETTTSKIAGETNRYLNLTIVKNVTVTVDGTLIVGGVLSRPFGFDYQGHTSSYYSQITVDGTLIVNGTLNCYGFIKGSGTVNAMSGSSIYEPFVVTDYVGGDNAYNMYEGGQAPFNRYAFVNIQSKFIVNSGSHLYGLMNLYANSTYNKVIANIVGQYEEGNALILLRDGASATMTYDKGKYLEDVWTSNIYKDIGKTTISINGGAVLDRIKITAYGREMDTGKIEFSIPYNVDILLNDGIYSIGCNFRILPGSTITVGNDAVMNVNGSLIVYDGLDDVSFRDKYYPRTLTLEKYDFDVCGRLIVDGTMNVLGGARFAGAVECTSAGASVNVNVNVGYVEDVNVQYGVNYQASGMREATNNVTMRVLSATVNTESGLVKMSADGTYTSLDDAAYIETEYTYTRNGTPYKVETEQTLNGTWEVTNIVSEVVTVTSLPSEDDVKVILDKGKNAVFKINLIDLYDSYLLDSNILKDISNNLHFDVIVIVDDDIIYRYSFRQDTSYVPSGDIDLRILRMASEEVTEKIDSLMKEKSPETYIKMNMYGGKPLPIDTSITYDVSDVFEQGQKINLYRYNGASNSLELKGCFEVDEEGLITVTVNEACMYVLSFEKNSAINDNKMLSIGVAAAVIVLIAISIAAFFYLRRKGNE